MGIMGVDFWCYGEYKCPQCNRIWESSKAWQDFGQKCKSCSSIAKATSLQALFHYICKSCDIRTKGKEGHWKYKLSTEGRNCRSCGENVKPFLTHSEFVRARKLWAVEGKDNIRREIRHDMKRCEKCVILGCYCVNALTKEPGKSLQDLIEKDEYAFKKISQQKIEDNKKQKDNSGQGQKVDLNASFISTYTGGYVKSGLSYKTVAGIGVPTSKDKMNSTSSYASSTAANRTMVNRKLNIFSDSNSDTEIYTERIEDKKMDTMNPNIYRCSPSHSNYSSSRNNDFSSSTNRTHSHTSTTLENVWLIFVMFVFVIMLSATHYYENTKFK